MLGREVTRKVLDDASTAPIDGKLRATLAFLKKVTLAPESLTPDDARPALALGATKEALEEAAYVAYLFNIYDRLADAFGWALLTPEGYEASGRRLRKSGYL